MSLREFFAAGLAMEELRERREQAREVYRAAVKERCAEELATLERLTEETTAAEKRFYEIVGNAAVEGQQQFIANAREHAANCKDPVCGVSKLLGVLDAALPKAN